ncbi:hypothetical protein C0993_007055 [Termitomyces sp. T159_Od127]|nr:hypothetical protein C0993_007055 [Termitomyces sp. T159_Od127]
MTLDDRTAIPLHPLDLTAKAANDNTARFCTGIIQSLDSALTPADMILGVPFLRKTYTVMAYEPPSLSGAFDATNSYAGAGNIKPRLGLVGITDPATALSEFNAVRVLNQPLTPGSSAGAPPSDTGAGGAQEIADHSLVDLGLVSLAKERDVRAQGDDEGWGEREDTLVGGGWEAVRAHERT